MTNATSELLQELIRNECVNDGSENSGEESRNAATLKTLFNESSIDVEEHHSIEGRDNIVARIEGSDPTAPSLLLLGHTDVVPAVASDWDFDPFGGEVDNGFVLGRGCVDMLNLTSSMAIAFSRFAAQGIQPKGSIIFAGVADEEAGGTHGTRFLLDRHRDLVYADNVVTESGGLQMPADGMTYLPVMVGEKGVHWALLDIDGTPSHGSKPYGADNAVVTAAQIIERITSYKATPEFTSSWETFLLACGIDSELAVQLSNVDTHDHALTELPDDAASMVHACCHTTLSPNIIHGGNKVNTVADRVQLGIDMRSLPGMTQADVAHILSDILGELEHKVSISYLQNEDSSISPTDSLLWKVLESASIDIIGPAQLIPMIAPYGTDARFYRRENSVAYGFGLFSRVLTYQEHLSMFHGRNERVDIESLDLSTQLFEKVIGAFV